MYLIVGANGFLGSYMIREILNHTNENIIATARNLGNVVSNDERVSWERLDIENFADVDLFSEKFVADFCNLKVIYLAAYHHPDLVEKNPQKAWNVNVTALSYFLNRFSHIRCLFYASTDTVYGEGELTAKFTEESKLEPVNRYGRHKALAEVLVNGYGYNVVRYPFLISPSLLRHKKHFYDEILNKISRKESVEMFKDSYRSSLDFGTVAKLTILLMEKDPSLVPKILNVSGDEKLSKYDIGIMIAKKHHISTELIIPVSVTDANGIFGVPRASTAILDNSLLKQVLDIEEIKINI